MIKIISTARVSNTTLLVYKDVCCECECIFVCVVVVAYEVLCHLLNDRSFLPECVAKGSRFTFGGLGVDPCSRDPAFGVRNRLQPFATVCDRLRPFATVCNRPSVTMEIVAKT